MQRKILWFLAVLFLSQGTVMAASVNVTENFTAGELPEKSTIQSGAVSNADVMMSRYGSTAWTGVYGNVTSEYVVGQRSDSFFSWDLLGYRYVYATSEDLNFSSQWREANHSDMINQYPFLENISERPLDTFNTTSSIDSGFQENVLNNVLTARTYNQTGQPYWPTMYANDGTNGFFAGDVLDGQSFNGRMSDFQLILPEDGSKEGGTAYSIYLELE